MPQADSTGHLVRVLERGFHGPHAVSPHPIASAAKPRRFQPTIFRSNHAGGLPSCSFRLGRASRRRPCADRPPDTKTALQLLSAGSDGMLRLRPRTGAVCSAPGRRRAGPCNACRTSAQALETRSHGCSAKRRAEEGHAGARAAAPGRRREAPSAEPQRELQLKVPLPSDAEIDRVMSAFEKMWAGSSTWCRRRRAADRFSIGPHLRSGAQHRVSRMAATPPSPFETGASPSSG